MNATSKKIWSIVLALTMVLIVFSGCTPTSDEPDASDSAAPTDTTDQATDDSSEGPVTLKLFVDEPWWPYTTWEGRIPEMVTEITGVNFEVTVTPDSTTLNLMIASGELGDIVCTGKFDRMSNANICYNLDELADEYDVALDIHSVMRFVNTAQDGNMYTQMVGYSPDSVMEEWEKAVYEQTGLVVRSDIYEALGSPTIETIADFENLLAQVKTDYPDVVPFIWNAYHKNGFFKILWGATHGTDAQFVDDGTGHVVPYLKDPNMKQYYMMMNKWYRLGYLTDENFAWSGSEDTEYLVSGQAFAAGVYSSSSVSLQTELDAAGVTDYHYIQMIDITPNGGEAKMTMSTSGWRGLFIPKSCVDPEAALNFCTWAWSKEGQYLMLWGEEGADWEWSEGGDYPVLNYDFQDMDYMRPQGMKIWGWLCHDGTTNTLADVSGGGPTYEARVALTEIAEANPVLGMLRMGPDSQEATTFTNLVELEKNMLVEIITSPTEEAAEAKYDEMIAQANNMGCLELEDWANAIYAEKKAEYDAIKDNVE